MFKPLRLAAYEATLAERRADRWTSAYRTSRGKKIHPVQLHSIINPFAYIVTALKDQGPTILSFPYYTHRLRSTYCICHIA